MDADENDLDRTYLPETHVPVLKLFPAGDKTSPVPYKGEHSFKAPSAPAAESRCVLYFKAGKQCVSTSTSSTTVFNALTVAQVPFQILFGVQDLSAIIFSAFHAFRLRGKARRRRCR